jgi:hypothetical protein
MLREIAGSSFALNLTSGAFNDIWLGIHSLVVKPGISRYSLNVLEMSFK